MADLYGTNGDDVLVADSNNNVVYGLDGNDTIYYGAKVYGGRGNDTYIGPPQSGLYENVGEGYDIAYISNFFTLMDGQEVEELNVLDSASIEYGIIRGNEFAQIIRGNNGVNEIWGRGGADTLIGLGGNDVYYVDNPEVTIIEAANGGTADQVICTVSYTLTAGAYVESLVVGYSNANLNLTGNELAQGIRGNRADNILDGGGGADLLIGGGGNDTYIVRDSRVVISEGENNGIDTVLATVSYILERTTAVEVMRVLDPASTNAINLTGNEFVQTITGNAGANVLGGIEVRFALALSIPGNVGGADTLIGLGGDDTYVITDATSTIVEVAGEGYDTVYTTLPNYTLAAGVSIERLFAWDASSTMSMNLIGNELAQIIAGNAGDNAMDGGGGADVLVGRGGDDTYIIGDAAARLLENVGEGYDTVYAKVNYVLEAGQSIERLFAFDASVTTPLTLVGNAFAQVIAGTAGANVLIGGGGADYLVGRGGDDDYIISDAAAIVIEDAGQGYDTVYSQVNYTLLAGQSVERLFAYDAAATTPLTLVGNEQVQILAGNAGANVLIGAGGADVLVGRTGDDDYIITDASAHVIENAGEGTDTVYTQVNYTLEAGQSVERLFAYDAAATAPLSLIGNELAQIIAGNAGANLLYGGSGADTLVGRGGDDEYIITDAAARVYENAGEGSDTVSALASYTLDAGQSIERLFAYDAAATTALNLTGNDLAQIVAGNAGANLLNGGAGADTLIGRGGADSFAFTTALGGGNVDLIYDFEVGVDKIHLDNAIFTGLATGALAGGAFVTGTAAADADDRIIYNSASGAIFFDADGSGAGAAVQFTTVTAGLALSASDFLVI